MVLLFTYSTYAQIELRGTVKDSSNVAIEFANVVLTNQKNEIVKGTITNENGIFSITVKEGRYKLSISFLGYKDWLKEISIDDSYDFGVVILEESKNNLDEVVIKGEKRIIEKKVDRLIFNVSKSISIDGGNAIDALKYTPLLKVNDGELSLIGKSGLGVMVDNRIIKLSGDDLTDFLQSLPSENIDKIEVITNPPAEYDAEGNSGLVNIILKKNTNDSFSGFIRSTYQKSQYSKGYLGGGFNFQKNKISMSLNVNSGLGTVGSREEENIFYNQGITNINEDSKNKSKFLSSRLEFNYDFSPKTDIGFGYLSNYSNPTSLEENNSSSLNELTSTESDYKKDIEYHSLNVFLKSKLDTLGKIMKVDFNYLNYDNESEKLNKTSTNQVNTDITERFNSTQKINFFTASADFTLPYKFLNMSVGTKLSFIETNSGIKTFSKTNDSFMLDTNRTNDFKYNEDIQALYLNFQKNLGKWSLKLGTRLELTQTKGTSISLKQGNTTNENNFSQLFPSAYVTYSPSEKNNYSLSYGKRVKRPNYSQLNPFRWYSNPFIYSEGNPFLRPYFIDNLEFSHSLKNNLNTTLYYSQTNNGSDQLTIVENSNNLRYTIWENFVNSYSLGLTESYTLKGIASWLSSYLQFNINYSKINSSITNTIDSQTGFNYYFQINNSFQVTSNKQLSGELNFWYSSSGVDGVYFLSDIYNLDLGLRYNLNEKWLFSVNFQDILNSNNLGLRSETNGISFNRQLEYDRQRIRFSVRYKFGNNKVKIKKVSFGNDSERDRLD
ncbi:TonB-dependent receptor domain-containing protein [Tenacibaculum sp. TC6]|uniref:TonB-dependent receptor domain-containing protein n=1 Tax=Tenacibaculum sp. TC6 TaxID=3423223 RepID=UPI003D36DCB5